MQSKSLSWIVRIVDSSPPLAGHVAPTVNEMEGALIAIVDWPLLVRVLLISLPIVAIPLLRRRRALPSGPIKTISDSFVSHRRLRIKLRVPIVYA